MMTDAMIAAVQAVFYRVNLTGDEKDALCAAIDTLQGTRERESGASLDIPPVSHFPDGTEHSTAIAVDFDGCLVSNQWPLIGEANFPLINRLIELQKSGCKLILWTCREGKLLNSALIYCGKFHELYFDAVNDNLPLFRGMYGNNPRKVSADYYIDDKAVCVRAEG